MTDGLWGLPSDWRWAAFEDVAHVASNLVDPADFAQMQHIAPNHIEAHTGQLLPTKTVSEEAVTSAKHRFRAGQVLYSKIRPYLAKVVIAPYEGLCSADMYPIDTNLDARFLKWWMLTPEFTRRAAGQQARTVLPKINKKALGLLPVPVPSRSEQERIVDILEDHFSRVDAASSGLRSSLQRISAYQSSSLTACREGEERVLAEVAAIQGGIQKQQKRTPRDHAYPFLRVANVTARGLELDDVHKVELFAGELERLRLREGDLLVVEGNGSPSQIGRAALWDGSIKDCVHQNHLIRVRALPGLDPPYLEAVWNSPKTRHQLTELASSSSGLHTLSVSKLKSLRIPIPSVDRQQQLVRRVSDMRELSRRLNAEVLATEERAGRLRLSLLAAAFSGRLTGRSSDMGLAEGMVSV